MKGARGAPDLLQDCPWPGPSHYREKDANRFLGRGREIGQLLRFVDQQRLTVLIALSGTGKSSLLYAGLVPALDYVGEQGASLGPALVVRDWGRLREMSPAALIVQGITLSIETRSPSAPRSSQLAQQLEKLKAVPCPSEVALAASPDSALRELIDYVRQLCAAAGGLVLILDQVEELLGSGLVGPDPEIEREVVKVIGALFQAEQRRLRLVLSLREEYLGRISRLSREVDGFDRRLFRLDPMPRSTAREVLLQTASIEGSKVKFKDEAAADEILSWLGDGKTPVADQETPVDLLRLQAVLVGLFLNERRAGRSSRVSIDHGALNRYKQAVETRMGKVLTPKQLARLALEDHIERVLETAPIEEPPAGPGRELLRRALVRMAPWLSSPGGFKRHVAADELIYSAIRNDVAVLGGERSSEALRAAIVGQLQQPGGPLRVAWMPRAGEASLAGTARLQGWDLEKAATMLGRSAIELLQVLSREGVLKSTAGAAAPTYELVHDGFGLALFEWAEREGESLRDTLAAIVSQQGEDFYWCKAELVAFREVRWLGCNLDDVTFRDVQFRDCELTGSIFTDCIFEQCTFENCDLLGTVFRGGSFKDVTFRGCKATSALFVKSAWRGTMRFESSILDNATLVGLGLSGEIEVEDCSLCFAQIGQFEPLDGTDAQYVVRESDLQNALLGETRFTLKGCNTDNVIERRSTEEERPRHGRFARAPSSAADTRSGIGDDNDRRRAVQERATRPGRVSVAPRAAGRHGQPKSRSVSPRRPRAR